MTTDQRQFMAEMYPSVSCPDPDCEFTISNPNIITARTLMNDPLAENPPARPRNHH